MSDFLQYIYGEVKNKRLSKADAIEFIRQFHTQITAGEPSVIHSLLHQNTSDFSQQRFSSSFTGGEFFLADHRVKGRLVLPGVAYLEMARAAAVQAAGVYQETGTLIRLENVAWIRPLILGDEPFRVHIGLYPEDNGAIAYEIYSVPDPDGSSEADAVEPVIHNQGLITMGQVTEIPSLELRALQAQCSRGIITSAQYYEAFRMMGIDYGPGYQAIQRAFLGHGQILAELVLPVAVAATGEEFVLHPSLINAAIQASIGLVMNLNETDQLSLKPFLPFTLEEVEIFGNCTPVMWAWIHSGNAGPAGLALPELEPVQKLDIDLCDETGHVRVRMKGFSARVLDSEMAAAGSKETQAMLIFEPVWLERTISSGSTGEAATEYQYDQYLAFMVEPDEMGLPENAGERIVSSMSGGAGTCRCICLQSQEKGIGERFQAYAAQVFEEIQKIFTEKPVGRLLIQIAVCAQEEGRLFAGLAGLLKTASLENSKCIGQLIQLEPGEDLAGIIGKLRENWDCPTERWIQYQDRKRRIAGWSEITIGEEAKSIPWKDRGVYLITGGAGGLGFIISKEITRKVRNATLILTGRSPLDEEKHAQIKELEAAGVRIEYKQVDVAEKKAVFDLIESIGAQFGGLDGIIHLAGVIRDSFISKKTRRELESVLAPKVAGLVNLDEASKDIKLDFLILFSSVAGIFGNPGQSDYATANLFMDCYAKYRDGLVTLKQRHGRTLSLGWPLWQEGGMRIDEATEIMMRQSTGMIAMPTASGIAALYLGLGSGKSQLMVISGNPARIRKKIMVEMAPTAEPAFPATGLDSVMDTSNLSDKVQSALIQIISKLLKVKTGDIDIETELNEYGLDSIMLTQFTNKINQEFQLELAPTIFFENPNLHSLTEYLVREHAAVFAARFTSQTSVEITAPESRIAGKKPQACFRKTAPVMSQTARIDPEPVAVAVVGMSGRFPMAQDLDEFWTNLASGRDCIREIPVERWDWREYYGDPLKEANKSNIKWGGFIDGVAEFDPLFFGISPKEAELMDPQQRLLITYVWKVIEDAGISPGSLSGTNTAIFIGTSASSGYAGLISRLNIPIEEYSSTGLATSIGPNRMSYLLNIHGPSEPIDTACSSSLVAIHRAVNALEIGNCEMAIAGGVNTILSPDLYISLNKAGMLCEDGRCKTFSKQANGYVRGEGVGMLFLKKLKDAERDGDHIYGIIRSTAENHGGRANSLTAPNPKAQAELMVNAYRKAGIDPRTVSYIEAHGTGTELGDPVEINGLKAAFKELYQTTGDLRVENSHCGLGSVKTNIGHLELAAGIAGVIKVLLQIKHKTLAKSLHCDPLNPYIHLQDSPFYIVRETMEWRALRDSEGREAPRRAGVSSFGFGGANAHVVIEEYIPKKPSASSPAVTPQNPAIMVLSARNEDRLKEQARQLLTVIKDRKLTDANLADLAYTLQTGRDAMEERLAMMVATIQEFAEKLRSFAEGRDEIPGLYLGQVKRNKETLNILAMDDEMQETVAKWIQRKKYEKLLDLWVKGFNWDWNRLYDGIKPRRINLPSYPFARERYWLPEIEQQLAVDAIPKMNTAIHPLLQQNTSDLSEQRYSSRFTGREFFLMDHVIKGRRIMPGVAYLEMARAAVRVALGTMSGTIAEGQTNILLKNIVWAHPIVVADQPAKVHIRLFPEDNRAHERGEIGYEIYSEPDQGAAEPLIHNQGTVALVLAETLPDVDLPALKAGCSRGVLSSHQCYETFRTMGIDYGPGHQGIVELYLGDGQVLAQLTLPVSVADTRDQFVLHPSIMDGALQATIGLMNDSGRLNPLVPFVLQELEVFGGCSSTMWALVRYSEDGIVRDTERINEHIQKLDIDLYDETGRMKVRLKGYTMRGLEENKDWVSGMENHRAAVGTLLLAPCWKERVAVDPNPAPIPDYGRYLTILCEMGDISAKEIAGPLKKIEMDSRCLVLSAKVGSISERFQSYTAQVFEEIQSLLGDKSQDKVLIQIVTSSQAQGPLFSGLSGLLQTARLENPRLAGQIIEWAAEEETAGSRPQKLIEILTENRRRPMEQRIRYQDRKCWVLSFDEKAVSETEESAVGAVEKIPWRDQGIYLITGGAGGLGLIFAKEIAERVKGITLVLTGRSPLDGGKEAKLMELEALGSRVKYLQVDVTLRKSVDTLIQSILTDFGGLHGIIHGAGVIRDNFIIKKTKDELLEVLAPKVTGLVNLDLACKDLALDFFITFSSTTGCSGNLGQADYAAANAFMDSYAGYRNMLVASKQRQGHTLSLNWPLWKEGGMRVDGATQTMLRRNFGIVPMETSEGIRAFYRSFASGQNQVMVLAGNLPFIKERLFAAETEDSPRDGIQPSNTFFDCFNLPRMAEYLVAEHGVLPAGQFSTGEGLAPVAESENTGEPIIEDDLLREQAADYLRILLSSVIKLPAQRIEVDAPLEKYGIDSLMVIQLTSQLEKIFGTLSKTLFFEYQNIRELTGYFLDHHRERVMETLKIAATAPEKGLGGTGSGKERERLIAMESAKPLSGTGKRSRFGSAPILSRGKVTPEPLDIAIIGLSGRYPQARNIQEFWENLKGGKDCITEIPKDRWDYSPLFDEDKNKTGTIYSKWGGFLEGVDRFDPLFFNISPREAEIMDPQERLFLECVYETLEDAGYTRNFNGQGLGDVGVFVGVMYEEYQLFGAQEQLLGRPVALAGNPSSIANRVSYFCNFHGPSIAVDTMCSSSLTAIYLACQSMQRNGCELAIAGGVNVSIHPNKYLFLSQGKFVSSKGRCESFGLGGDGYVPGEGVGAVLLKPLPRAIADGDHIYGVIKGAAINHGGKTNGYSVPNPNAQAAVIGQALREAKIDPRTLSFIEAHGTGTSLGDPIEIAALTKIFAEYTPEKQFCAIGSAKSNIGHCESAAGIAGVTKVLLQLQHGQLVPSLHSRELNPNIDFQNTPFTVQQTYADWKRPLIDQNGALREYPRRAGISSFGAGGSNAHIIIEEYIPVGGEGLQNTVYDLSPALPAIIVISAKNEEQLKEQVRRLLAAIRDRQFTDEHLADMAYTLQVGREAMEERLAMMVSSLSELKEKLEDFSAGRGDTLNFHRGQVKRNKETLLAFTADEELREAVDQWIKRRKYDKLLDFWVKGLIVDWNKLYTGTRPRRISLPTYPFAEERCWLPRVDFKPVGGAGYSVLNALIHPLLQQNTSSLWEQRFSSTFTGREFFLADHIIRGERVLPGVASLEMARAAVDKAVEIMPESRLSIRLKNVVWARPVVVKDEPVQVNISLYPEGITLLEGEGVIDFEIYGQFQAGDPEPLVYSRGTAELIPVTEIPSLDLPALQAKCRPCRLSPGEYYKALRMIGLNYGPAQRGIEELFIGTDFVLAKLSLPAAIKDTYHQYELHPCIIDSAWQASAAFIIDSNDPAGSGILKPALPFALQELEMIDKCSSVMWALIHKGGDSFDSNKTRAEARVTKLDMDVCDDRGKICVRMKGLSTRVMDREADSARTPAMDGTMLLEPYWREEPVNPDKTAVPGYEQHLIILCELDDIFREINATEMNGLGSSQRRIILRSKTQDIGERFQSYTLQVFEEIQNLLKGRPKGKILVQVAVFAGGEQQLFTGLHGLLQTARLENPKLTGQLIEMEPWDDGAGIMAKLTENGRNPLDHWIGYRDGKRWVAGWNEIKVVPEGAAWDVVSIPWKDRGVYLITGGAGGLGLLLAGEIGRQAKDSTIILTGRTPLAAEKQAKLKELESSGARIEYREVDVTDKTAVNGLIQNILMDFGNINGIIHSAGVNRDNFILKKTGAELLEVLAPKVSGMVNLDHATRELSLDCFILFSSITGSLGNAGQADYAAANAFMDAFAKYRNGLVASQKRQGLTLAVNWPFWQEGGMHIDRETLELLQENTGMIALPTETGIRALYHSLATGKDQVMVVGGDLKRLRETFLEPPPTIQVAEAAATTEDTKALPFIAPDLLPERAAHYFGKLLAEVIKLPARRIEADVSLENYGIDSVMVLQFTNQLEKTFGSLPKTLFFEYPTIRELSGYFLEAHRERLIQLLAIEERPAVTVEDDPLAMTAAVIPAGRRRRLRVTSPAREKGALDIAIIGLSGRYPGARDIREFWNNLRDGKDCITEIPKDRWDYTLYFDPDKDKPGKTYSKWGGFIEGVDQFDPLFFNISPREAALMDPQERLFLQYAYETLEDAGYTRHIPGSNQAFGLGSKIGVYVGVMYEEYQLYGAQEQIQGRPVAFPGNPSSIANRVSYFGNFHGPSMAVDTMCSSSLTAIHLACHALAQGECELAIAGGVNVSIHPNKYLALGQGKFVSSKGRCESFGEGGDGYVPGEGVGAVLLKPLSKAIADNDHIYGVIKGTAINHGGKTNGYTVPNPNAQAEVIGMAIREAGINPRMISYLEAHGTGTSLGDPIEIAGLTKVFREYTQDKQFCAIGSAKSNIGHCESAAGIAGVTKVLLQLAHCQLAPSLHSKVLNPHIDFNNTPFTVQQELAQWKRPVRETGGQEYPRVAGISAFGAGGANAHVIIEEYIPKELPRPQPSITAQDPAIIVLSAKTEAQLRELARRILTAIRDKQLSGADLADIAYTLQVGREAMEERLAIPVSNLEELEQRLESFGDGRNDIEDLYRGQAKRDKENMAFLTEDEDMQKTVDLWLAKGKYGKLLELWVKGLAFDWNRLYGDPKPRRLSLPTYPFATGRYWFPKNEIQSATNVTTSAPMDFPVQPPAFQSGMLNETSFSMISAKPSGIPLRPLAADPILVNKPEPKSRGMEAKPAEIPAPFPEITIPPAVGNSRITIETEVLREELAETFAAVIYMKRDDVDIDKKFVDMGLDSIIGVEWTKMINKKYGTSIIATKLYDYPSIRELAGFLEKELNKTGGVPVSAKPIAALSLDELLLKVQQGTLDIEQANQLLNQYHL